MATSEAYKLVKLSDSDETIANGDEDIRGHNVTDKDGEDIGKVDDLLIDPAENKVRFLEIASGGFLGIGVDKSFMPVDAIAGISGDEVRVDHGRSKIAGAPTYDPELDYDKSYYDDIYGYYGYSPFWVAGYVYPGYPYYG